MKKNKSMFEIAGEVFTQNDFSTKNPFFVNRILSFQPRTVLLSIDINKRISKLPLWATNALFNNCVRKTRSAPYIYYPKAKKISKDHLKLRKLISSVFHTNDKHTDQIILILKKLNKEPKDYFGMKL